MNDFEKTVACWIAACGLLAVATGTAFITRMPGVARGMISGTFSNLAMLVGFAGGYAMHAAFSEEVTE